MYIFHYLIWMLFIYICVHFWIFVYISVYSYLSPKDGPCDLWQKMLNFQNHRASSNDRHKMRRAICDNKSKKFKIIEHRATIAIRCAARFATKNPKLFIIFLAFTNFPKFSKIFKCPKTSKIDISWPLAFPVTYRTHQKSIFWWIFKNFKIVKNRIFW